ncbi:hypothetical protein PAXRUDRAFT_28504 [Paxillus rubicundulus Ve08.2h10]|uniref:Uncharacterized protein n=1 Tax=Paxillus rubicundulus Ve08.2h10 TaxID=930991 RepID=A0A0D0DDX8_9AGAM|nr:hypothetical protein PAXRUDRAFT_28504 [Paxillus rubicundulus Ve08.2h10]
MTILGRQESIDRSDEFPSPTVGAREHGRQSVFNELTYWTDAFRQLVIQPPGPPPAPEPLIMSFPNLLLLCMFQSLIRLTFPENESVNGVPTPTQDVFFLIHFLLGGLTAHVVACATVLVITRSMGKIASRAITQWRNLAGQPVRSTSHPTDRDRQG